MSSSTLDSTELETTLTPELVADYLQNNPEFFLQFPELATSLQIPHDSGQAVSLIEKQVQLLRDQNQQYKRKLMELVDIGRENDALHANIHRLTIALMSATSLQGLVDALFTQLLGDFNADAVGLRLAGLPNEFADTRVFAYDREDPALAAFENFFRAIRPICGFLKPEQLDYLFQDKVAQIKSSALIPLGEHAEYGLLAVGSDDEHSYHPGHETQFLRNIGDLVACALSCYLKPASVENAG